MRTSACRPPAVPVVRKSSSAPNARFTNSISSTAGRTARYGVTLRMPWRVAAPIAVVLMAALLERSAASRARNDGLGRSRRSWAMRRSSVISASPEGRGASGRASRPSSASARRSIRDSSLMDVPHACSQALERAKLQLLHRAFGAPESLGDLADALLLDEAGEDDALLIVGQAADQVREHRAAVGVVGLRLVERLRRRLSPLARLSLPAGGDGVARDPHEPRREGQAAPLEAAEIGERLMEHFGGEILGFAAAAGAASHERVDLVEVLLVQLREPARIGLRRLDQQAFVVAARGDLRRR